MWEEPCISGDEGSGTVFFVGCPLGCIYCQNYKISSGMLGREYSVSELADAFIDLQSQRANNINLVTPTHYSYQIIDAVREARRKGLILPIVYNCSGYELTETIRDLEETVDIYLVDYKYSDSDIAKEYSQAADYPKVADEARREMVRQKRECTFNEKGMMTSGVIVRNLCLPGHVKNSKDVVKRVYEQYGDSVYLSIMNQYTPLKQVENMPPLNRKVTKREYKRLIDFVYELGIENAFIQEGDVADESFIPEFM